MAKNSSKYRETVVGISSVWVETLMIKVYQYFDGHYIGQKNSGKIDWLEFNDNLSSGGKKCGGRMNQKEKPFDSECYDEYT